jgi:GT2 family glycosyltransferase
MKKIALVICTRNRANHCKILLENLTLQARLPDLIVIVDSSDDNATGDLASRSELNSSTMLLYEKSLPGLPLQRNIGVQLIFDYFRPSDLAVISFLDDDMTIDVGYFKNLGKIIQEIDDFVAITGVSEDLYPIKNTVLDRILLLGNSNPGKILLSGQVTQPNSFSGLSATQWMPGLSMNINPVILVHEKFDESIRMYGEDLEFSLRLNSYGYLKCSADLTYRHMSATAERENISKVTAYTDGILWKLARIYPLHIKRWAILWSIIGLIVSNLIYFFTFNKPNIRMQRIRGHTFFLFRVLFGRKYIQ